MKKNYPKLYWTIRPLSRMKDYINEDEKFTSFLINNIEKYFESNAQYSLIDFGTAFASKTRKIKENAKIKLFIGVETNLWILFGGFKKNNPGKSFFIRRTMQSALKLHKRKNHKNPILFLANSSMMYLTFEERLKVITMLPAGSLIIITEPITEVYTKIFETNAIAVLNVVPIPKNIYNPGIPAQLYIAKR